jgi:outer membrane protein
MLLSPSANADTQFLSLTPTYIPSYFGIGVGSYPQYIGADDNDIGAAPFGRYSWGENRYIALEVNYATLNLVEDRKWRLGPAGTWRFGRKDVDDDVVNDLPEIDGSLELGGFFAYEEVAEDSRDRWVVGGSFTHGVTGDNDGYTVAASFHR